MSICHNHPTAKYKGTEPSPKGTGYCARAEKLGVKMQGRDNRTWIVRANKNGVKRWAPVSPAKKNARPRQKAGAPLSFRMVIGYFRDEKRYKPDMSWEDDKRPYADKTILAKFAKGADMWNKFDLNTSTLPVSDGTKFYNVRLGTIRPRHVKRVKVLSAPVHDPTFWEKLVGTHAEWMHKPDLVLVVDLENAPTICVSDEEAADWMNHRFQGSKEVDEVFYEHTLTNFNHQASGADDWINWSKPRIVKGGYVEYKETEPFRGNLWLLQMGSVESTQPDYRRFHV
jgi:hypothetical protein